MKTTTWIAAIVAAAPAIAAAHGPQLQIYDVGDKIVTRQIIPEGPYQPLTEEVSAYVMPLLPYDGVWYSRPNNEFDLLGLPSYFSGPGLAYGLDQTFAAGESFSLRFTDGLKWWDGAAFVDAGDVQLEAFLGTPDSPEATAATTDGAPFAELPFAAIADDYGDEAHATARYRLLGNGADPTSSSPDGVFLASLQLSSSQAGLAPSDEFYFVLHKNSSYADVAAAVDALGVAPGDVQMIPEPSSWLLAAVAVAGFGWMTRRGARS